MSTKDNFHPTNGDADPTPTQAAPLIAELRTVVSQPAQVPTAGEHAAEEMNNLFEDAAQRIEALAQEGVSRALDLETVAKQAATNLRKIGDHLRQQIELESTRARQIGLMMEEARNIIGVHGMPAGDQ